MPNGKCSRATCSKDSQYKHPTDPKAKRLCFYHFRAKYGMTVGECRRLYDSGTDPLTGSGLNYELMAVAPDGRGYDLHSVGSGHLLRNLNIDNESVAMALNMTPANVVNKRLSIIKKMFEGQLQPSKEHLIQTFTDILEQQGYGEEGDEED